MSRCASTWAKDWSIWAGG